VKGGWNVEGERSDLDARAEKEKKMQRGPLNWEEKGHHD